MRKRIRERDLILPALEIMSQFGGSVTTRELIIELRARLQPSGEDLRILDGRTDDKFSQIVRNLRSHKSFERLGVARYGEKAGEEVSITVYGRKYLAKQLLLGEELREKKNTLLHNDQTQALPKNARVEAQA